MLRPIPAVLLKDSVQVSVCKGLDAWQVPQYATYTVKNVMLQNTNEVKKSKDNTEVVLRSILFIDGLMSTPQLDFEQLVEMSEAAGAPLTCTVTDYAGHTLGPYTVVTVDPVPDVPETRIHHTELGLV